MRKLTVLLLSLALAVSATAATKKVIQPKDFPTGRPFSPGILVDDTVAVQVYLTDMVLFPRMNAVYTTYFKEPRPARTTVGVAKLVGTARIEVTVTAHRSEERRVGKE